MRLWLSSCFVAVPFAVAMAADRETVYHDHDTNGDHHLDAKELKALKRAAPDHHASLLEFCELAKAEPAEHGVHLADGRAPGCSHAHVDKAYLDAWIHAHQD